MILIAAILTECTPGFSSRTSPLDAMVLDDVVPYRTLYDSPSG